MARVKGRRRALIAGSVVIAVFGVAVVFGATAHEGLPGSTEATVQVAFDDVGSLRVGDDVRVGGVRVGRVGAIEHRDGSAVTELELTEIDAVYRDAEVSTAAVGARSALGAKFVRLDPGSPKAGKIGEDEVISTKSTTGAEDVTELFDALDKPTRDSLGSLLRETGAGFAGHQGDISDVLSSAPGELKDLRTVSRAVTADGGADLTNALQAIDDLAGRFEGREQNIAQLNRRLATTMDAVNVDQGDALGRTVESAPSALRQVRSGLRSLDQPLTQTESAMRRLRPAGTALASALPDTRAFLREAPQTLNKVPGVSKKATPAVRSLTGVMVDARPLAPQLTETFDRASDPIAVLKPYSPEIARAFTNLKLALDGHDGDNHWLRVLLVPGTEMAGTGNLPIKDPTVSRNPYPEPGKVGQDRRGGN